MPKPAAFRRLCVETGNAELKYVYSTQPPLGGCVLKHGTGMPNGKVTAQPPLGGCVLKLLA